MSTLLRMGSQIPRFMLRLQANGNVTTFVKSGFERCVLASHAVESRRLLATQTAQQMVASEMHENRHSVLDETLQKLDEIVRKMERVSRKDVEDAYLEMKLAGKVTSMQSLLILRCCGSLLAEETPENRTALVNNILNTLNELGVQFDIGHYNTLLKVYLDNEHKFNPAEFLSNLEKKGIIPNRVTYLRFIEGYCQAGDIDGAGKILEHMKKNELPINEKVFNALITGHARANDMERATEVLGMMRNANLEPSAETYATLLCAYAEKGDMKTLRETMRNIRKQDIILSNEHYLNIIYALAKNGHTEHVNEISESLQPRFGFINDLIITIMKLINCNQEEIAFTLLKKMPPPLKPSGEAAPTGIFFIRHLIRSEKPADVILHYCRELKNLNLNSSGLLKAVEIALYQRKPELAVTLLKALKQENFPVRPHYFWPIFCNYRKMEDKTKIYEVAKHMLEFGCPANYHTFVEYIFPALNINDPDFLVKQFKDCGYTSGEVVTPLIEHLLNELDLNGALALLEKYMVRINPKNLVRPLAVAYMETQDLSATVALLKKLNQNVGNEINRTGTYDWTGMFLLHCVEMQSKNETALQPLLDEIIREKFTISQEILPSIQSAWRDMPEPILKSLQKIATSSSVPFEDQDQQAISHPREMSVEELEAHLIELRSKNMNVRGVLRRLLLKHCAKKNLERAEELKVEMDAADFVYSYGMLSQLMELYVHHGKLEDATAIFTKIKSEDPHFALDAHKLINYCNLLLKEDKYDEVVSILSETIPKREDGLERNVWRLLNTAAEKDIEKTDKLFDIVMKQKLCEPTNVVLGPLIKCRLLKKDISGAVEKFLECSKNYSRSPWKNEIIKELILKEDAETLQKVVDVSTKTHGENNTLHDLAFCLIELQQFRQAKKVFATPGLRAMHMKFDSFCEKLIEANKILEIEETIKISEDLFDVDRDQLYLHLIRAYYKLKDPKKALEVWTTMQEENVQPSDKTLIYLANFLKEFNDPVPFIVPEEKPEVMKQSIIPKLRAGEVDGAVDVKRKLEASGSRLDIAETSSLIESLVKQQRLTEAMNITKDMLDRDSYPTLSTFRFMLHQIALTGDTEAIKSLEPKLNENLKSLIRYNNILFSSQIHANKYSEVLDHLEKNVEETMNTCPTGAFLQLLALHPELTDRVEKLGQEYAKHGFSNLLNAVWENYFINENYAKVDTLLKDTPGFQTRLTFRSILRHAETTVNGKMLEKLLACVKATQLPPLAFARIYGSIIEVQTKDNKLDDAVKTLENAQKQDLAVQIPARIIKNLTAAFQLQGKTLPISVSTLISGTSRRDPSYSQSQSKA